MAIVAPTPGNPASDFRRRGAVASVAIHATIGSADAIDMRNWADAAILIPTGVTSVTFWGCDTGDGTPKAIYDSEGNAATITTTADRWYTFPAEVFPHNFVKIVSAGANGTATCVFKS